MSKNQTFNNNLNSKLYEYYMARWGLRENSKGWLVGDCPHCDKSRKYGVSLQDNKTNCFICGRGPNPFKEVGRLEGLETFREILNFLKQYEGIEYKVKAESNKIDYAPLALPNEYRLITDGTSTISNIARNYLKGRGFNITTLRYLGVGYCTEGIYGGRIIFPYYKEGKLIYFNARALFGGQKFLNPSEDELGYGKNQVMYNHDALKIFKKVYIVESVTNAITLGEKAIAIGGKVLSQWQLSEILRSEVERVVILLDDDAMVEAYTIALRLSETRKVKVVRMPEGKDVNKIGKKATLAKIKEFEYLDHKGVLKEWHRIK